MTTVAAKLSGTTMKFNAGTAALAIAAATVLTPAVVAQAEPAGPASIEQAVGTAAGVDTLWFIGNDGASASDVTTSAAAVAPAIASVTSLFQNQFLWVGPANTRARVGVAEVFQFTPLNLIPGFLRPLYGWFTQNLNFQVCVFGAGVTVGPYGTVTGTVSSSGC